MIKVQAFKESQQQPQPGRQDYLFEEKPKGNFAALAFLTVLAGFAVYLKSFLSPAQGAPAEQQKKRPQNTEDDTMSASDSEEQAAAAEAPAQDEAQKDAAGDSDNVVPMAPRRTAGVVDSFLASDSPSLLFAQPPRSAPVARSNQTPAANDNLSALKPLSGGEKEEVDRMGVGGSNRDEAPDLGAWLLRGGRPQEIADPVPSADPEPILIVKPSRQGGSGLADRNRLPRTNGPITLPDLVGCHAYFIPLLALLAGASDADGDPLKVLALSASSGTLVPVEGGWMYTPDPDDEREVVFAYDISDGAGAVQQVANLRIVDAPPIVGTDGDDNLLGTACGDVIDAKDGDDNIVARQGSNLILAGNGADHIGSGTGPDIIFAGAGNDIVFAGAGNDIVYGGAGNDRLFGEDGDDTIFGEEGDDFISGGAGNDVLLAGAGNDTVHGGSGKDVINGGSGDDDLDGEEDDDKLLGEEGDDFIKGGPGDDKLLAGAGNDLAQGDTGNDEIDGGIGDDVLRGGEGDDTLIADAGNDKLDGGAGNDVMQGGEGDDTLIGDAGNDELDGGTGDDTLIADAGNDALDGGAGDDDLQGGEGDDALVAGSGNDELDGGTGDDVLSDGQGSDVVDGGSGDDQVAAAADGASDHYDGGTGEGDTLDYSSAVLDIFVNVGDGTAESLEVGRDFIAGFERIIGGQGDDHFVGGSGPISMAGGDGDDTFEFKASDDNHQPDLVRKITDFTYGDRIIAARYEIFYRKEEGAEEKDVTDLFKDIYLSENSDQRPIRFRFEKLESGELTFVEVHDQADPNEFYSIELPGRHDLEFTVMVS